MVEQASSFFDAASAARGLDVDRGLLLETRPADLRSSSSPEVASQGPPVGVSAVLLRLVCVLFARKWSF